MSEGPQRARRLGWRVWRRTLVANYLMLAIELALFLMLAPVPLLPHRRVDAVRLEVGVIGVLIAVGTALAALVVRLARTRETSWIAEERPPTDVERRRLFSLPIRAGLVPLPIWVIGIVILDAGFTRIYPFEFAVRFAVAASFGYLGAFAFSVLFIERALGPFFGAAMSQARDGRSWLGLLGRLLVAWMLGGIEPLIAVMFSPQKIGLSVLQWVVLGTGLVLNLLLVVFIVRRFVDPLGDVQRTLRAVEGGDLDVAVEVSDGGELGELQVAVNQMITGLRERRRLHDLFGRHVGSEVARHALENDAGLGGEACDASVFFVDLVGSTTMAQTRSPDAVVATLNRVFGTVASIVEAEGGWVNKFHGDGALCVFGVPDAQDDHAARALRAARTVRAALRELSVQDGAIDAGIGVSSGSVIGGNVGAENRYEYTVIGDPVNEAARLSDEAKSKANRVLASARVVKRAPDEAASWCEAGSVQLRGRSQVTELFEPRSGTTSPSVPVKATS